MPRSTALPNVYPSGSMQTIINYLYNRNTDKWAVVEAAYDLLGYGLAVIRNNTSSGTPEMATMSGVPDNIAAAKELEGLIQPENMVAAGPIKLPSWLAPLLLKILTTLLTT